MNPERFVYVVYIRTNPEKLWDALLKPEFTRAYWYGCWQDSEWKVGSSWRLMIPDGRVGDAGEVLEIDPPRKLYLHGAKNSFPICARKAFRARLLSSKPSATR